MQYQASERYRRSYNQSMIGPSSRTSTYRALNPLEYKPYSDDDRDIDGLLGKMTSKISGMFKGIKTAVGSIFKNQEEEDINLMNSSGSMMKNEIYKDEAFSFIKDHPINNINFDRLGQVLSNVEPIKPNEATLDAPKVTLNGMNISFGGSNKNFITEADPHLTLSFHSYETFNSNSFYYYGKYNILDALPAYSETSDRIGKRSPVDSKTGKPKKRKEKVNIMRVLNFCHIQFDQTNESYTQASQRTFNKSLKSVLTKDLPKPTPLRSNQPTIEFKYNKVIGKYELSRLLKKKKRTNSDSFEQEFFKNFGNHTAKDKANSNLYKKSRMSQPAQTNAANIMVDLKNMKKTTINSNNQYKKSDVFLNNLETYETDETEEHDLKRGSPLLHKIFEEDKDDFKIGEGHFDGTNFSHVAQKKDQGSQTLDLSQSSKQASPLRSKSLMRLDSIKKDRAQREKGLMSEVKLDFNSQKDSIEDKSLTNNSDPLQQENSNKEESQNSNTRLFERAGSLTVETPDYENKDTADLLQVEAKNESPVLPKTPNFNTGSEQTSLFQFNNQVKTSPERKQETSPASISPKIDTGINLFSNIRAENKTTNENFVTNAPIISQEPELPKPVLEQNVQKEAVVEQDLSFLQAYQTPSNPVTVHENNPFLKFNKQASPQKPEENESIASKGQSFEAMLMGLSKNPSMPPQNPQPLKALNSVTNIGLFSSLPQSQSQPQPQPQSQPQTSSLFNLSNQTPSIGGNNTQANNPFAGNLFGAIGSENKPVSSVLQNPFQNSSTIEMDGMDRETSMGAHNNPFQQKSNNSFGVFENNKTNNLFGNLGNSNTPVAPTNNLFQSNQTGGLNLNQNTQNSSFLGNLNNSAPSGFGFLGGQNNTNNNMGGMGVMGGTMNNNMNSGMSNNLFGSNQQTNNQLNPLSFNSGNTFGNNGNSSGMSQGSFLAQATGSNFQMGNQTQSKWQASDASNFLGTGNTNNNPQQQERKFKKIIVPGSKNNKERAF